jgi:hypothetical protein
MSTNIVITDYSCTKYICGPMIEALFPEPELRPKILAIPATGFSAAHEGWVRDYQQKHGGEFVRPFAAERGIRDVRRVGLVGFSAGCWGVGQILENPSDSALSDFVYTVDGLHGSYIGAQKAVSIPEHWITYAKRAMRGEALFVNSFSAIVPPSYPGTQETAANLAAALGLSWAAEPGVLAGMPNGEVPLSRQLDAGAFHMLGAWPPGSPGMDAAAHIYQANVVQPAVWRAFIAPWWHGERPAGILQAGALPGAAALVAFLLGVGMGFGAARLFL